VIARRVLQGLELEAHHLWPTLPERWRQAELNLHARQSGIALVPSEAFAVGPAPGAFRVSLGAAQTGPCWNAASASCTVLSHGPSALSSIV
jgi:DNA-binding transcriptional MocR family regulator